MLVKKLLNKLLANRYIDITSNCTFRGGSTDNWVRYNPVTKHVIGMLVGSLPNTDVPCKLPSYLPTPTGGRRLMIGVNTTNPGILCQAVLRANSRDIQVYFSVSSTYGYQIEINCFLI